MSGIDFEPILCTLFLITYKHFWRRNFDVVRFDIQLLQIRNHLLTVTIAGWWLIVITSHVTVNHRHQCTSTVNVLQQFIVLDTQIVVKSQRDFIVYCERNKCNN